VDRLFGGLLGVDGCFVGAGVAFGARGNVVDQRLAHEYGRAGMQPQRHFDGCRAVAGQRFGGAFGVEVGFGTGRQ
jgi:hypothetical protein